MENYSSWNSQIENCQQKQNAQRSACIPLPSSLNPYNVTALGDFTIGMLGEIINNTYFSQDLGICYDAINLLPLTIALINETIADPYDLNVPILSLYNLTVKTIPYPWNASDPGQVTAWWWNNVQNDTTDTSIFIGTVKTQCVTEFCTSLPHYGDPDISGIGMLISTGMLIFLAVIFAVPTVFGWRSRQNITGQRSHQLTDVSKGRHLRLRDALVGTLDDLINAIIIFTLSVDVAALVIRVQAQALYEVFMAETLSLISGSAMVMVAAAYWASYGHVDRLRPSVLVGVAIDAILTIVLLGFEFRDQASDGIPLEKNCLTPVLGSNGWRNPGGKIWVIPLCFAFWFFALLGSLIHIPMVRAKLSRTRSLANTTYALGLVPIVLGSISLVLLCRMFYLTYEDMKKAYGHAFTTVEQDWSFGQLLALATWVPPFLQFSHILFAGMRNVLRSRLPHPWDVSDLEQKEIDRPLAA